MGSILKSLSIRNFKGFSDEVRIELHPITLLFGANSAGKSSILHAFQYVREILERGNVNADRTLQGGDAVDLGGFLNLVHGRDPEKRIEIEIEMALGDSSIPELVPEAFEDWQTSDDDVWSFYSDLQNIRNRVERVSVRLVIGWSSLRDEPVVVGYEVGTNGVWCVKFEASDDGRDPHMRINRNNPIFMVEEPDADTLLAELDGWVNAEDLVAADGFESPDVDSGKTVALTQASVLPGLFFSVQEAGMERPGDGLRAWLSGFRGALPRLGEMLYIPAPGASGAANIYIVREFTAFLSWLTIGPAMLLRDELRKQRYLGPLRRIPSRGFDVSLTKSESAWSDGMAAWETLLSGSQAMLERSSDWMQATNRLNTGYGLARSYVREHDLKTGEAFGRVKSRLALVDKYGLQHQPQDVGVGISQVLPVVVAAQDDQAGIVMVEQPELHVHPSVQVGLGDLFIDGVIERGLSFLLETHSEHLILRVLRRIREAAENGEANGVTPSMLGVYYLFNENGRITISQLPVNTDGDFDKPWPRGFFEERGAELF